MNICFVCHGNICRSPMAEYVMKHLVQECGLSDKFCITSRAVSYEEIGNGIYPPAQRVLRQNGIPFGTHHASRISKSEGDCADYLVCMDQDNIDRLKKIVGTDNTDKVYLLMSFCGENRSVLDPWWTGNFDIAFQDIQKGCKALLDFLLNTGAVDKNR